MPNEAPSTRAAQRVRSAERLANAIVALAVIAAAAAVYLLSHS